MSNAQPAPHEPAAAYASWGQRVAAYLVDALVVAVSLIPHYVGLVLVSSSISTDPLTGEAVATGGGTATVGWALVGVGVVIGIGVFVWNICLRQGRTGYSIGKSVMGIRLLSDSSGAPIGAWMAFVRYLAHVLDALPCYLGYLWPLWDAKRQTFADKVTSTVVRDQVT